MGAFKQGLHLRQCFYVSVIHEGIHPSSMNRHQAMSVSFRVGNTTPVQYHFVLEEAWAIHTKHTMSYWPGPIRGQDNVAWCDDSDYQF